ncbi:MAG TPA: LON peptidase substrate-binding domain-containing protein [Candidatus Micrarchaeia archaeon]|nr:LON peptidase substrate-binding domain-containing protein [Candidatus Micrarchaeia archaeon]
MPEIALFPLHVVLFPHMPLELHVFEPRYRAMLRDCEATRTSFGVIAIRRGSEVGGEAEPHAVGTLARIEKVERLPTGAVTLQVAGTARFQVVHAGRRRPYPVAEIAYLPDRVEDEAEARSLAQTALRSFGAYAGILRQLADRPDTSAAALPEDPELLSYLIAATLAVELPAKQRLLEAASTVERLREALRLLRRERTLLEHQLAPPVLTGLRPPRQSPN